MKTVPPADKRLADLYVRQEQLLAQIRDRGTVVAKEGRRRDVKAKILLGGALMGLPAGERGALLGMLLPRRGEREREFVTSRLPALPLAQ